MRLIDADTLMTNAEYKGANCFVSAYDIANAPTVDLVKHGQWETKWNPWMKIDVPRCSVCSKCAVYTFAYCPNCGAKMEEVEE